MGIFNYKNFFKKKEEEKIQKPVLTDSDIFDADKFNDWFCNEYDGYDGRVGNKGIFLRLDKLSPHMIHDWFEHLDEFYVPDDIRRMTSLVREDWLNKLSEK